MNPPFLPTLNASLNALAGILLFCGWIAIKQGKRELHKKFMIAAFTSSTLFLVSYLYYHFTSAGITRYKGTGLLRTAYFIVLGTHTPLATLIVPFILMALWYAYKGKFDKHVKITRWLYPTWVYVSITGVIVYLMLYIFPAQ